MAFSHDMFTFLIICFIIPQLIIVQAQKKKGTWSSKIRPAFRRCESARDCLNGQICDDEEHRCYEERNVEFKGKCKRNAGKFYVIFLI